MAILNGSSQRPLLSAHPLHYAVTILLFVLVLGMYHRGSPSYTLSHIKPATFESTSLSTDLTLSQRLSRSETLFQRSREARTELFAKYGTDPESYSNHPEGPWPAMTVWDFFYPAFNCPHEMERIGATGDGGKWVCGLSRIAHKPCVIYSFGINYESSFEAGMLKRSGCSVWGYDFSVESFGPEITSDIKDRSHFFKFGLAGEDNHNGNPPMYTLESLLKQNGHTFIDVLKIDIETYEFETLETLLKDYDDGRPLPFGQLLIEVHAWASHFPRSRKLIDWFNLLENAGLRPFMNEPNMVFQNYNRQAGPELVEFSFLNTRGRNAFISD